MNRYQFAFIGREINSIGITSKQNVTVYASSLRDAEQKLYESYEHISVIAVFVDKNYPTPFYISPSVDGY